MFQVLRHKLESPAIMVGVAALAGAGASIYSATRKPPSPPPAPKPPTQDTAANAALEQQKALMRRRGVLANIYAGGNAPTPQTTGKQMLGN